MVHARWRGLLLVEVALGVGRYLEERKRSKLLTFFVANNKIINELKTIEK